MSRSQVWLDAGQVATLLGLTTAKVMSLHAQGKMAPLEKSPDGNRRWNRDKVLQWKQWHHRDTA